MRLCCSKAVSRFLVRSNNRCLASCLRFASSSILSFRQDVYQESGSPSLVLSTDVFNDSSAFGDPLGLPFDENRLAIASLSFFLTKASSMACSSSTIFSMSMSQRSLLIFMTSFYLCRSIFSFLSLIFSLSFSSSSSFCWSACFRIALLYASLLNQLSRSQISLLRSSSLSAPARNFYATSFFLYSSKFRCFFCRSSSTTLRSSWASFSSYLAAKSRSESVR